jgi:hypothetical protein
MHRASPTLLLLVALTGCSQAGAKIGTEVLQLVANAAASAGKGSAPRCTSCPVGEVCDADGGSCISRQLADAQARARRAYLERPEYEIPPDPCAGRCQTGERCEPHGDTATCVPEAPPEP